MTADFVHQKTTGEDNRVEKDQNQGENKVDVWIFVCTKKAG